MKSQWRGITSQHQSQASSSPWVCPITIKACNGASFWNFQLYKWETCNLLWINWTRCHFSNINKHHQKTMNSYFRKAWYDEDIVMGLYINVFKFKLDVVWRCEHIFNDNKKCSFILIFSFSFFLRQKAKKPTPIKVCYLCILIVYTTWHFTSK